VTTPYALPGLLVWASSSADAPRIPDSPVFGVFAEAWMARQEALAHGGLLRISTLGRYETALRAHLLPFFAARPLDSITRAQCDDFRMAAVASGRLNPGTVNSIVGILGLIVREARREGLIERDPLAGVRPLRVAVRLVEPYDPTEIRRLLDAVPPHDRLFIALAALAGLRQGEALAIRPSDVSLPGRRLRITRSLQRHHPGFSMVERLGAPKTTLGFREVPLQASLAVLVENHLAEHWKPNQHDLLCPGSRGQPYHPTAFYKDVLVPAIHAAGLRHTRYHDLRRSFIARCVESGIPVAQTAAWTGHTIRMMEHYYQVGHAQLAAALARLDEAAGL
jgi:integrase